MSVLEDEVCQTRASFRGKTFRAYQNVDKNDRFCAGSLDGQDSCGGDRNDLNNNYPPNYY